jgi:hypothetical protein
MDELLSRMRIRMALTKGLLNHWMCAGILLRWWILPSNCVPCRPRSALSAGFAEWVHWSHMSCRQLLFGRLQCSRAVHRACWTILPGGNPLSAGFFLSERLHLLRKHCSARGLHCANSTGRHFLPVWFKWRCGLSRGKLLHRWHFSAPIMHCCSRLLLSPWLRQPERCTVSTGKFLSRKPRAPSGLSGGATLSLVRTNTAL